MNSLQNVSRRAFIGGIFSSGALVIGASILPRILWAAGATSQNTAADTALRPNLFVAIEPDDAVSIVASRSEMGTGSGTALPLILADELDADWTKVRVHQADGDPRYGDQDTDGSHSVRSFFDLMRRCGAAARMMLIEAAAQQWNVTPDACEAELGVVLHRASGRKLTFGQLASAAAKLPVPDDSQFRLKPKDQWRYIGKEMPDYYLLGLCTGEPLFGIDQRVDGMLYASVERPPVFGGKVKSYDDKAALRVGGVRKVISIPPFVPPVGHQAVGGIAVLADNTWSAMRGRQQLKIEWDNGPNATYDSQSYHDELLATSRNPGRLIRAAGDVAAEFAKGGKTFEADYYVPLLSHAPMEPPAALADFGDGKVTVWAPTQDPQTAQKTIASELDMAVENVTCHVTRLGGAFGRKSMQDFTVEAAYLSKASGQPVKVTWSREDDIKFDYYNAVAAMHMKAALDKHGKPTAWLQRSTFPPITCFSKSTRSMEILDTCNRDGPISHLIYPISASKTAPRRRISVSDGCDQSLTSTMRLRFRPSLTSSPISRGAIHLNTCSN
jgi:isoquinoline 1-oxidoreductase beta subunit